MLCSAHPVLSAVYIVQLTEPYVLEKDQEIFEYPVGNLVKDITEFLDHFLEIYHPFIYPHLFT